MTKTEMLALPWTIQEEGKEPKSWSAIILVPTQYKYGDTEWRVMAVIGCVRTGGHDKPTHVATTGDIIKFDEGTPAPTIDMDSENDCVSLTIPGHLMQVRGVGGSIHISAVKKGGEL